MPPRVFSCVEQLDIYSFAEKEEDREYLFTVQVGDLYFETDGSTRDSISLKSGYDRTFSASYEELTRYFVLA